MTVRKVCACGAQWYGQTWEEPGLEEPIQTTCDRCVRKEQASVRAAGAKLRAGNTVRSEAINVDLENIEISDELRQQLGLGDE